MLKTITVSTQKVSFPFSTLDKVNAIYLSYLYAPNILIIVSMILRLLIMLISAYICDKGPFYVVHKDEVSLVFSFVFLILSLSLSTY